VNRISGDVSEDRTEAPVAEERVGHPAAVQEPTVFAERQIPYAVDSQSVGLIVVVQLANGLLRRVPGVQAMVLLVRFSKCIGDGPGQDAGGATRIAELALFELDLKSVGAVLALLDQVVGDAATEDWEWPQQVGASGRCAGAQAGGGRQNAEERIRQGSIIVARIGYRDILIGQSRLVHVIAELDVVLIVAGERNLSRDLAPQLVLDSKGVLIGMRHTVAGRIEADATSDAGQSPSACALRLKNPIRERIDERIRPGQAGGRSDAA